MTTAPNPLRQALWPLGLLYGGVAALRNLAFDRGWLPVHRLPVPVVSVGNLTVGGTGKTPTVAWLAEQAHARGRRVGVLARGYGRQPGQALNDEGTMLQRALPWLLQEQDPDRIAGGRRLLDRGADFVVLDDGFQHRRLHRDVDLVCLDATLPFGNGQCLPAGDLREFRSGLRRADVVLLTRAGGLSAAQIDARRVRLRQLAQQPTLPIYACEHAPVDLLHQPGGQVLPLAYLAGTRVALLSGLARPDSFAATVQALGAIVVGEQRHRDHHAFTAAEVAAAAAQAQATGSLLLLSAKDDARLGSADVDRLVLRIALRFLGDAPRPAELAL